MGSGVVPSPSVDESGVGTFSGGLDVCGTSPSGAAGTGDSVEAAEGLELGLAPLVPAGKTTGNLEFPKGSAAVSVPSSHSWDFMG